ncbi:prefoldin subunit 5-like [Gigantopelta aegis]|uniref:prefoldin subunit 5-like n=1 Tax=Gigantopelta aegis TaxID=1735272 RepID=UPI001B88A464|nr:prefoldin subunit 5-like [Gigantopelta aegis]
MATKTSQPVDISQLPIAQLNQLSQQIDQEIEFFTNSMNQLKMAQGKYVESGECLHKLNTSNLNKEILVPLTSSMYVPGKLSNVEEVLVDVGTGFYVEKNIEQGKEYFKKKVDFISKQIEKIQPVLQEKYRFKQVVMEVLQMKVSQQVATQQSATQQSASQQSASTSAAVKS